MINSITTNQTADKDIKKDIYQALLEELSAYEYLLQTMQEKKNAIIKNEIGSIEHLSGTEHLLVSKADQRTAARYNLMQRFFESKNPTEAPVTLSSFIDLCDDNEKGTWERTNNRLSRTVENIRYVNNENRDLLETSMKYVNGMISLFLPRDENSSDMYAKEGRSNINLSAKNLLDCNA